MVYNHFNTCVLDFDEDDPLAGLLSDDEDSKPKKKGFSKQKSLDKNEAERPRTGPRDDDDDLNSQSME